MNAVGIDVSKGKSTIAVMQPFGVIVVSPYEVAHTETELSKLAAMLKSLSGEAKVIMECTGAYHLPIAYALQSAGLTVCAVHSLLVRRFGNNTIRKTKSDPKDALKIANYGLTHWLDLPLFTPSSDTRLMLKAFSRQYDKYVKLKTTLKNNLIALTDHTFPSVNDFFTSPARNSDGHEKWFDFFGCFWHCKCVSALSEKAFSTAYRKWCTKYGYYFCAAKAKNIHNKATDHNPLMPFNDAAKALVKQAVTQILSISETIAAVSAEMKRLASSLPEYPVVIEFHSVGDILAPQLIAEIGDVGRFPKKSSLVRFAGLEPVEHKSGKLIGREKISKQGSPHLRKTLFLVVDGLLKHAPTDNPVFQFLDRKRAEGKNYYSYMTAASAKFLRIYYARVKEFLNKQEI
ncbi:MAG: IS110 family transposase [Clostridiales bacterium]|jgi:transposase|nr:IS110 family transposase [Clostridiales bacterium]